MSIYEKRKLIDQSYDDRFVKVGVIEMVLSMPKSFFEHLGIFGYEFEENSNPEVWVFKKTEEHPEGILINVGIDLTRKDDPTIGIEVENGKWENDFWANGYYEYVLDYGFPTLNMPDRKERYWEEYYDWYDNGNVKHNPNFYKNAYARANTDLTQIIFVFSDVICDPTKVLRKRYQVRRSLSPENWLSWRREHVITLNKVNGKWLLDTEAGGEYQYKTEEEIKKIEQNKLDRIKEVYKNRNK